MNEILGIEQVRTVFSEAVSIQALALTSKCPQIRCTIHSVPQKFYLATLTGLWKIHRLQAGDYYHIAEAWFRKSVWEYTFE